MIPWLTENTPFPPVESALRAPNGLLAAGGDLSAPRLLAAYRHGVFPWFNPGDPILWWSPDPRMVLIPQEFKISRSLAKVLRNAAYEVRCDTAFEQVMRGCSAPRGGHHGGCDTARDSAGSGSQTALPAPEGSASPCQGGHTWIHEDMIASYCKLHEMGYAHSVEVWMPKKALPDKTRDDEKQLRSIADAPEMELAGGLYGVSIGRIFYGESMFSNASNASKIALAHLSRQLERWRFGMIDCQMNTSHLASLGAREIPRSEFIVLLQELVHCAPVTDWQFDTDLFA